MSNTNTTPQQEHTLEPIGLCSGFGQFHTNDFNPAIPGRVLKPYEAVSIHSIARMVEEPQKLSKAEAQWLIPSTLLTRTFAKQREGGEYWLLWADLDKNPKPIKQVSKELESLGCDFYVYTSRSATEKKQKARILIPLAVPLSWDDYMFGQECLNDWLDSKGLVPDRVNQRSGQLCFLPNKGEFYDFSILDIMGELDPLTYFKKEIAAKRLELKKQEDEASKAKELAIVKRAERANAQRADVNFGVDENEAFRLLVDEFNACYAVEAILLNYGYTQRGNSFSHPNSSSGSFSASVLNGRVHSLSSTDPLFTGGQRAKESNGAHDAFSVFSILNHGGDNKSAAIDAGDNYLSIGGRTWNKAKQIQFMENKSQANVTIDLTCNLEESEIVDGDIDLTTLLGTESPLADYVKCLAKMSQIPVNTVFFTALSTAASVLTRCYSVSYQNDTGTVPAVLNLLAEQPPGSSKSRVLSNTQKGIFNEVKAERKRIKEELERLSCEEQSEEIEKTIYALKKRKDGLFNFTTDTTPEALDATLKDTNGFFALASAEQGLINTLLGLSYGNGTPNMDLMLKGYNGEYHSSKRKTRETYTGIVVGGFTCLAQHGVIVNSLRESGSTGLIERCILWSEPSLMGQRDHLNKYFIPKDIDDNYRKTMSYLTKMSFDNQVTDFADLPTLRITDNGWNTINTRRNELEKTLAGGGENSAQLLQGFISKMDLFIMKIAAVLHSMDMLLRGNDYVTGTITDKFIEQALCIYDAMLTHTKGMIKNSSIVALSDREAKVLDLIENSTKGIVTLTVVKNKLYRASCFKVNGKANRALVAQTVDQMAKESLITVVQGNNDVLLSKA